MPLIEVEIGEDGTPVKVPEAVQKLIDKAFGQGQAKATDGAQAKVTSLQAEITTLKAGSLTASERETLKSLELEKSRLEEALATANKDHVKAQEIRDKRHADELAERDGKLTASAAEVAKRTARIQQLVAKEISAAAIKAGARTESLQALESLLGARIGLDDGLQAFVKDAQDPGKAALDKDGKTPLSIEGFVAQYLTDNPYFKSAPAGRGGGARAGQSFTNPGSTGDKAALLEEAKANPSIQTVASLMSRAGKAS